METTQTNSLFTEYTRLITKFRLPRIDMNAVLESRRKDVEALAHANATVLTGLQSLAQKQAEIVDARLTRIQSMIASKKDASESKPATSEAVHEGLRKSLSDVQELAETVYRAQADSIAVISKRVAENVEEWKALLQSGK